MNKCNKFCEVVSRSMELYQLNQQQFFATAMQFVLNSRSYRACQAVGTMHYTNHQIQASSSVTLSLTSYGSDSGFFAFYGRDLCKHVLFQFASLLSPTHGSQIMYLFSLNMTVQLSIKPLNLYFYIHSCCNLFHAYLSRL